ncbi:hypothetical protein RJ641_004484 [Dillenia turbinata]|uniref:Transmembrane protein n=1 Tax=Dillenia turbinata TaxID=194707 RepID=A0AAN8ZD01_9MAGN
MSTVWTFWSFCAFAAISKMNLCKVSFVFIIAAIFVILLSQSSVEATRVLSEDFAHHNHLVVYEKAKYTVTSWLERLASGPSPRGPGH